MAPIQLPAETAAAVLMSAFNAHQDASALTDKPDTSGLGVLRDIPAKRDALIAILDALDQEMETVEVGCIIGIDRPTHT